MNATTEAGFDIAAREAHVIGDGPRIAAIDNDALDPDAVALVDAIRISAGAGPIEVIPEYMRTVIKHPEIFRCQMEMGTALFKGRIPPRERELAILRIGWQCRAPYEFGQHVIIAKRVGLTSADVERAVAGPDAAGWSAHEAAILSGVDELIEDKALSDDTWATLVKSWDEVQMIEFPMMVGQYVATAYLQNSLRIPLEPDNPGLASR